MDEVTKKKIAYKLRGRKKMVRTKMLISRSMSGRSKTDEHRRAISEGMKRYWELLNRGDEK